MNHTDKKQVERKKDIAIIGLSGKFPKSEDIREFWKNLAGGKELIQHYQPEELRALGVDEKLIRDPDYIRSSALIDHPEHFDYTFFGYTKGEAELMDPQTRLMHEQIWWALEDAGCNPEEYPGKIGLYLSASDNLNWRAHTLLHPNSEVGSFMGRRLADKSFISTMVAYNLDLRGPVFYTDTACSSSLTAVHFACRSLLMKECGIALAGGASIITSKEKGYRYEEGMIASIDGHCRAFDKDASGTLFGEGVGVVVLKRMEDAILDKDHIYAVIRSTAVNNDGKRKVGYTAPSVKGQAECISLAHRIADVEPASISYIEAHGTGTRIGDAIEIEALNKAFNYDTAHRCAIGTVKSNLGHLDAAAGVAGLIKAALSLKNKVLLPSINFSHPHPDINFASGPFYVNNKLQAWEPGNQQVRRAGVSSFGIGGTNAHVILEESLQHTALPSEKNHRLLVFSAKTTVALDRYQAKLKDFIQEEEFDLSGLAYTLQTGRKHFQFRNFLVCDDEHKIFEELDNRKDTHAAGTNSRQANKIIFMFSGGGSQYFKMAAQLYQQETFFSALMDEGFQKLEVRTGWDFKKVMGYTEEEGVNRELINSIQYMLPALFLVEYAIAKLLIKTGVRPDYMIGHSLGEYVAACISGVFSFDDALDIVIKRGELTDRVPEGGMVGVELTEKDVQPYLTDHLSIAAINMHDSCVISGPKEDIRHFIAALIRDDISFTELKISVAAHSSMFDVILNDYRKALQQIKLSPPQIPFVSNLSGKEITAAEATSPEYWVRHLRNTVNFFSGIGCLLEKGTASYIEIGSGGILTSFLKQHPLYQSDNLGVNILKHPKEIYDDHAYYLHALGRLWKNGAAIDWDAFNDHKKYNKVAAPGYAFDKTALQVRVDPFRQLIAGGTVWGACNRNLQESLFFVNWKKSIQLFGGEEQNVPGNYLVFVDTDTLLQGVLHKLRNTSRVIEVRYGDRYEADSFLFTIDPFKQEHYEKLFKSLDDQGIAIDQVIYNWNINGHDDLLASSIPATLLCQQLIVNQGQHFKKFTFITGFGWNVSGNETPDIPQNLVKETVGMIISNNAAAFFSCLDIDLSGAGEIRDDELLNDIKYNFSDAGIAYRDDNRWVRFFDRIKVNDTRRTGALKHHKNYLIVNGTSRTGSILSEYLSDHYDAKIIITGNQQHLESRVNDKKQKYYYLADAADQTAFLQLIDRIEAEQGKISGVILTGNEQEISDLSDLASLNKIHNKKLHPVRNLYVAFMDRQPDFVWIPLRLSSELHSITEHIYADAYTKMFADRYRKTMHNWHIISLDDVDTEREERQEIPAIFELSLNQHISNAIISFGDIDGLKKKKPGKEDVPAGPEDNDIPVSRNYVAAESKLEAELCELWQSFLVGKIGTEDNFFELGGNSLKAMTMLKRIQKQYNVQLDLKDFYVKPTVKLLSQEISIAGLLKSQKKIKERSSLKI